MKYKGNIIILCLFISIFLQKISGLYIKMHFPLDFKNIKILYTSKFNIYLDYKIIVDYPNEIIFSDINDYKIKILNYKGFEFRFFNYYPNIKTAITSDMKPQDYQISSEGINYYFSKGCYLYLYNYYDEPKWKYYHRKRYFENLENEDNCVLEMAFNDNNKNEIAVYNLNNKKITVINLHDEIINKKQNNAIQVKMDKVINQALIYSDKEGTKLIGIDLDGTITFWGLHGLIYDQWLINTFKFQKISFNYYFQPAGIIGKEDKRLLYIYEDDFILFDLKEIKIINKQNKLIPKVSTLLILDNKQGLVGTNDGFIYLIELFNDKIKVLDIYELCPGKLISNISYNTTCPDNHEICYIFAANCGNNNGYFKIFQIQNKNINDL